MAGGEYDRTVVGRLGTDCGGTWHSGRNGGEGDDGFLMDFLVGG